MKINNFSGSTVYIAKDSNVYVLSQDSNIALNPPFLLSSYEDFASFTTVESSNNLVICKHLQLVNAVEPPHLQFFYSGIGIALLFLGFTYLLRLLKVGRLHPFLD